MTFLRQPRPLLILIVVAASLFALAEKPADIHPVNYVTDLAGVLDSAVAARIDAVAGDVDRKTGAQIAVVTVKSLEGRPIEDYAVELYKQLGIGQKRDDRGVLLLVAPNERKYRIEVGYGLESVINDARAGDIGREMVPYLRQNDYNSAVELASGQIATRIADASNVKLDQSPVAVRPKGQESQDDALPWWIAPVGFLAIFLVIRALSRSSRRGSRRAGFPWWLGPGGFGGGWGGGGFTSGGWGGSSGGGGGFGGFGGGMSGGGGASGSW
jgi:uncharacterized protein